MTIRRKAAYTEGDDYTYKELPTWRRILEPLERTSFTIQNLRRKGYAEPDLPWKDVFAPINPFYKSEKGWGQLPEEVKGTGTKVLEGITESVETGSKRGVLPLASPFRWEAMAQALPGAQLMDILWPSERPYTESEQLGKGLAADVAMDPWTYLDELGVGMKAYKAIKPGQQWAKMTAKMNPYFRAGAVHPATKHALEAMSSWRATAKTGAAGAAGQLAETMKLLPGRGSMENLTDILKVLEGPREQVASTVARAIDEFPDIAKFFDEAAGWKKADKVVNREVIMRQVARTADRAREFTEQMEDAVKVGAPRLTQVDDEGAQMGYVLHNLTSKGRKWMYNSIKALRAETIDQRDLTMLQQMFGAEGVSRLVTDVPEVGGLGNKIRKIPAMAPFNWSWLARRAESSINQMNDIAGGLGLPRLWEPDIRKATSERALRMWRSGGKAAFLDDLTGFSQEQGWAVLDAAKEADLGRFGNWRHLDERVFKHLPAKSPLRKELSQLNFQPELLKDIDRTFDWYVNLKPGMFWKYADKLTDAIKQVTLLPRIPYHFRNDFTDTIIFNWMMEGIAPQRYADAGDFINIMQELGQYPKWSARAVTKGWTPQSAFSSTLTGAGRALRKVLGGNQFDAAEEITQLTEKGELYRLIGRGYIEGETPTFGKVLGYAGGELGKVREDLGRVAQYAHHRLQGDEVKVAVDKVLMRHYDYSKEALSPFEIQIMNRLQFFYRWTRFNLPGSARNILQRPGRHATLAKSIRAWEHGWGEPTDIERKYTPDWMGRREPILAWRDKEGAPYMGLTESWLPISELSAPFKLREKFSEGLAPLPKALAEIATGREIYFDQPLERYPGERRKFLGTNMPSWMSHVLRQIPPITDLHRTLRRYREAEGPQDKASEILRSLTFGSRTYKMDTRREAAAEYFRLINAKNQMERDQRTARIDQDWTEYDRLQGMIIEVEKEMYHAGHYGGIH